MASALSVLAKAAKQRVRGGMVHGADWVGDGVGCLGQEDGGRGEREGEMLCEKNVCFPVAGFLVSAPTCYGTLIVQVIVTFFPYPPL